MASWSTRPTGSSTDHRAPLAHLETLHEAALREPERPLSDCLFSPRPSATSWSASGTTAPRGTPARSASATLMSSTETAASSRSDTRRAVAGGGEPTCDELGQPDLTAVRFVPIRSPASAASRGRPLPHRDLARLLPEGAGSISWPSRSTGTDAQLRLQPRSSTLPRRVTPVASVTSPPGGRLRRPGRRAMRERFVARLLGRE